ncbi:MAG: penicillin-binding transpeptidase domain-containing protein, partial [Verrucomicrobiota bacterium]
RGLIPGVYVNDNPIARGEIQWTPGYWSPNNSDGEFHGLQAAEYGLIKSRNTMTVRVGERAGIDHVLQTAKLAGFDEPQEKSAQVYIGNLGGDLRAVTSAYSAFAQDGVRMRPYVIQAIQNRRGDVLYANTPVSQRVVSPAASYLTNQTLQKVITEGTGVRARTLGLKGAAAGKTGTTNDYHDAWFVGFNDKLTCGVWVGLDQPQTIMDRGYGSTLALPIWTEILKFAQENGYPSHAFLSQVEVVNVNLCRSSGQIATKACERQGHLYQTALPYEFAPQHYCPEHGWRLGQPRPTDPDRPGFFGRIREWFR